jgi:thiamine-phosphate pyrophosphorylase
VKRLGQPPYSCLITRGNATAQNFESERLKIVETLQEAAADGVSMVQIREKLLPGRMLFDLVSCVVEALADTTTLVIVNERADVAAAASADGVHLRTNSIPADAIRSVFANDLLIGVSTHSVKEATSASAADYIYFGPVFATPGKTSPVGLEKLKEMVERVRPLPVIALGGIDDKNFRDTMSTGADGVAAIRSLHDSQSRRVICRELQRLG